MTGSCGSIRPDAETEVTGLAATMVVVASALFVLSCRTVSAISNKLPRTAVHRPHRARFGCESTAGSLFYSNYEKGPTPDSAVFDLLLVRLPRARTSHAPAES